MHPVINHLRPSRLTAALRTQRRLSVAEAANLIGLTTAQLQYLEDHTKRLSAAAWLSYRHDLAPIVFEGDYATISLWDWVEAKEASGFCDAGDDR